MIAVHLPPDLAGEFALHPVINLDAGDLGGLVADLDRRCPGIRGWLTDADGRFRDNLSVFVSGLRLPAGAEPGTPLEPGAEVWVLRAISGG